MKWARVTKGIGGDSNYALAAGLYGYAFANAAELVRDYEGWSDEDFTTFKQWMLDVWYPSCIGVPARPQRNLAKFGKMVGMPRTLLVELGTL